MLAIGFLSLLSVGFAVMAIDVDDTTTEEEVENTPVDTDDSTSLELFEVAQGDVEIEFSPGDDLDPDDEEQINEFVDSIQDNPQQDIGDVVTDLHALLDSLEEDDAGADESSNGESESDADAQNASQVERPPMGDAYRDPIKVADELEAQRLILEAEQEAQRIADEIAAEEARQPVNLVTVSETTGPEVSDDLILTERPDGADETDPAFTVIAPDHENDIAVGYDAEHTFKIEYNAQTSSIEAGLNSTIEGPDGVPEVTRSTHTDDNDVEYTEVLRTKSFEGSADITLNVAQDDIGPHVAQIDLINPEDALHFEFDADVTSAFHLVYEEIEEGRDDFTDSTKRAYVIETSADVTSLTASDIARILEEDDPQADTGRLVSEIYLGEDSFLINGDPDDGVPYETRISNFTNDDPQITANVDWTSIRDYDEEDAAAAAEAISQGNANGGGNEDNSPSTLLLNAGINPGFFGF